MSNKETGAMSEQKNEKSALVPRLRFPEFRGAGEWTHLPLSQIVYILDEKAGNKKLTLLSITSGVGLVSQIEKFGREIAGAQYKNYYAIQRDDFAYNKSSTKDYPEGFIARYQGDQDGAVPNSIFTCFRVRPGASYPPLLGYMFANNLHGKWLKRLITVGARAHGSLNVDNKDLLETPVPVPPKAILLDEQRKIADCLSSFDELIAAEVLNLESLKAHQMGLMQHLFPAEGKSVPRLRFPEFCGEGEWEKQKVSSLLSKISNPVNVDLHKSYQQIGIRSHGKGVFHKEFVSGKELGNKRVFWVEEDAFIVNIVFAWEQAVAITTKREWGMIASHRFPMYKSMNGMSNVNFIKYFFLTKKGKGICSTRCEDRLPA
jgi:type I restriction enzyme S subunit